MTSVHRLRSINAKKTTRRHIIVKFWRAEQRKNKNSKGRRKTTYNLKLIFLEAKFLAHEGTDGRQGDVRVYRE